jgi:hypothetical protein
VTDISVHAKAPDGRLASLDQDTATVLASGDTTNEITIRLGGRTELGLVSAVQGGVVQVVVDYGEAFTGIRQAAFTSVDGQTVTGTIDGRTTLPFPMGADPSSIQFADGAPPPTVIVAPAAQAAIQDVLARAQQAAGACPPPFLPRVGGDICQHCEDNCAEIGRDCAIGAATMCILYLFGWGACVAAFDLGCAITGTVCLHDCDVPGAACCPVSCPFVCCDVHESCAANNTCCPAGQVVCSGECCDPGITACNAGTCCPQEDQPCGGACCPAPEQRCADASRSLCCGKDEQACGGTCCASDLSCADEKLELCCAPGFDACGGSCCPSGECREGGVCCPTPLCDGQCYAAPCGDTCCEVFESQCIGGACCPTQQACGATCCPPGDVCADPSVGTCCPEKQACGAACCVPGQTCLDPSAGTCGGCAGDTALCTPPPGAGSAVCCEPGADCCYGACCPAGQLCCPFQPAGCYDPKIVDCVIP